MSHPPANWATKDILVSGPTVPLLIALPGHPAHTREQCFLRRQNMDGMQTFINIASSTLLSSLCSLGIVKWTANATRDRWMAGVKAEYDEKLEKLKNDLDRGSYVSKAQWDLELNAYKDLWEAVGKLRNDCRSLIISRVILASRFDQEPEYLRMTFSAAIEAFHNAHNATILATDRHAPFYPQSIRNAIQEVTAEDMNLIKFYTSDGGWFTDAWFEILTSHVNRVSDLVAEAEAAIRARLNSVRVQS